MINLLYTALGFIPLILGADWLVKGSASLARRRNIPDVIIGLTIVAFGTSAPELIVNLLAAVEGNPGFSYGNVLGSNIINILLILGLAALIRPMVIKAGTTWIEIPLCLLSAIILLVISNDVIIDSAANSVISRNDGIILMLFFAVFMYYSWFAATRNSRERIPGIMPLKYSKSVFYIIAGIVLLAGGGQVIIYFAKKFAVHYAISERLIGLTILSVGTSLPELTTSIIASIRKNADISIGNIIGSNIFNTFLILGASSAIAPIAIENMANTDLLVNILATLLIFIFVFTRKGRMIDRWEGGLMVVIYILYMFYILK